MKIEVIEIITQLLFYSPNFLPPPKLSVLYILNLKSLILTKSISLYFLFSECARVQYHFSYEKTYACFDQNNAMNFGYLRIYAHLCNALQYILIVIVLGDH